MRVDSARGVACYGVTQVREAFSCVRIAPETVVIIPAKGRPAGESSLKALLEDSLRLAQR